MYKYSTVLRVNNALGQKVSIQEAQLSQRDARHAVAVEILSVLHSCPKNPT